MLVGGPGDPSFAQSGSAAADPAANAADAYRVNVGDILKIQVFGHPDVSGEFEVDAGGNITFPLLGYVKAEGIDVGELKENITLALDKDYLVNPRVSVEVLNFRPFFILGQVNAPGSYPYRNGLNIRQAVALGGGYTRRARTSSMTIVRIDESGARVELEATEDTFILPGDTIEISRRIF